MSGGVRVAANLAPALAGLAAALPTDLATTADLLAYRRVAAGRATTASALEDAYGVSGQERRIGPHAVTVFRARTSADARVVFLHGGGLVAGNRFDGVDVLLRHAAPLALEVWTVEYPLAPEATIGHMASVATEVLAAAAEDGRRLLLAGQSAGGGVAAAAAMQAREQSIRLDGLMLVCPMLSRADDLDSRQFAGDPAWSSLSSATAWQAALGTGDVPPGEREDLRGLPPTYLDTGSAELFRSAVIAFAGRMARAAVPTELHVWSGGFHAFDCVGPEARVSIESHRARGMWLQRWLADEL